MTTLFIFLYRKQVVYDAPYNRQLKIPRMKKVFDLTDCRRCPLLFIYFSGVIGDTWFLRWSPTRLPRTRTRTSTVLRSLWTFLARLLRAGSSPTATSTWRRRKSSRMPSSVPPTTLCYRPRMSQALVGADHSLKVSRSYYIDTLWTCV